MAKSWEALEAQIKKVESVLQKLTPPEPDDEFEAQRSAAIEQLYVVERYSRIRYTGVAED